MTTSEDLRPTTTETALEIECGQMLVALKPSGIAGDGMRARRSGACLCQPLAELPKIMSTCGLARLHLRRSTA